MSYRRPSKKQRRVLMLGWIVRNHRDERAFRLLQEMGYTSGGIQITRPSLLARFRAMTIQQALGDPT